ncbi:G-alpha domain-containing protein [Cephalotus follicularis]|uniref:G-alpha domain-containing protein n=1 Tax=Cephalotus follicularis TaxID=3775 RepID=A0A1Q3C4B6_CEPFO|nr:G-alpha domain-containing protein [Cephalotus follicularis]
MAGLLKKIFPILPQALPKDDYDDEDDKYNIEYSFAMEYHGPPVAYEVPRAVPVDVDQIPVAAALASAYMLSDKSLPVIQPIVETRALDKKSYEPKLGSKPTFSPNSTTTSHSNGWGVSCESAIQIDGLGALDCRNRNECMPPKLSEELGSSSGCKNSDEFGPLKLSDGRGSSAAGCANCGKWNPSDEIENSLGCVNDGEVMSEVCNEIRSSCKLRSSSGQDDSHKLSGNLASPVSPDDCKEDAEIQYYVNPTNSESTESESSSCAISSEIFSCREEEGSNDNSLHHDKSPPHHDKRPPVVTFCDPESNAVFHEDSDLSEAESIHVRPKVEKNGKKGECSRCLKGNRFSEKEICIVCNANYCGNCVLRAMGSMPEGRKCVSCIGFRIDESNRRTLGKSSWMLRRLLTKVQIDQIMHSEISCPKNQLPPESICVNDEPLSLKELLLLQNCPNPPKKLGRGCYWYDKVSGFWGKKGQKPCQIITSQLDVGGNLKKNASNGNTNVMINNREITKPELRMLQAAGVQCEGTPSFWVSADGTYQEEGQKNIKGNIWDKTRAKVACVLFSLPFPSGCVNLNGEDVNAIAGNLTGQEELIKLLLVGYEKSGTSTIYKQAKLLYNVPFSEDERQSIKLMIQSNLYRYLGILLEGRQRFEEESLIDTRKRQHVDQPGPSGQGDDKTIYSIGPRLKVFSDWLLKVMESGNLEIIFPAASREYAPFVEELWKDAALQATYIRRSELEMLPRGATYFLERAVEISRTDYEPTDMDIQYSEGIALSNGLSCMEFSFPNSTQESYIDLENNPDPLLRYQLIRVNPISLGGNCKWLEMFEDVDIVLFCVSLTDYDEFSIDSNGVATNKMIATKKLFEKIITQPTFDQKGFLLILNKFDLLEEKIEQVPLSRCEWFDDFNPVISHNRNKSSSNGRGTQLAQSAFHYIAVKFKRLFTSHTDRKLFVSMVTGLESDSVDEALKYAREIQKWYEEEPSCVNPEMSSTDIEASSS